MSLAASDATSVTSGGGEVHGGGGGAEVILVSNTGWDANPRVYPHNMNTLSLKSKVRGTVNPYPPPNVTTVSHCTVIQGIVEVCGFL